uniref:Ceramide synthase 6 n=1 Tax=Acanthochromis polyacanthus TaxID=80966 RepID=A0A3Q1G0Y6_9TELE
MAGILAWFWNERFWLPHNVTWADLKNTDEATFPQAEDLYLACPLAFCIFMIRLVFERFIARPCAMGLKIQANGPQKAQPNAILEKVFTAITKHPDEKRLEGLSKQLDWDVRTIQRWFRQRRNQEKPSTLARFCESMWRFTFYLYIFTYGVRFLKKTPWLWNTKECWYNYPYQVNNSFRNISVHASSEIMIQHEYIYSKIYYFNPNALCVYAATDCGHPLLLYTGAVFLPVAALFPIHRHQEEGFPNHVPAPCGNNLPHHIFLCEQHGASGNSGHVSARCSRRADRGCQDGQLCQMSDTVQPPVCNVCNPLHKFQAGSLPCLDFKYHFVRELGNRRALSVLVGLQPASNPAAASPLLLVLPHSEDSVQSHLQRKGGEMESITCVERRPQRHRVQLRRGRQPAAQPEAPQQRHQRDQQKSRDQRLPDRSPVS